MVWIETPTNPLLKLVDIQGAAEIVHQHEASLPHNALTLKMIKLDFRQLHSFKVFAQFHMGTQKQTWKRTAKRDMAERDIEKEMKPLNYMEGGRGCGQRQYVA